MCDFNKLHPFEEHLIHRDHYGTFPSEPIKQKIGNVEIVTRELHRTGIGLRDIAGADLLYEIEGEKFGLIQYKTAHNHNVKIDSEQLHTLLGHCPERCMYNKNRPFPTDWLPRKINCFCGAWYCVFNTNGEEKFVHACEVESIFNGKQSVQDRQFDFGLSRSTFLELFSSCRIGALVKTQFDRKTKDKYLSMLLEAKHLIFEIVQKGKWSVNSTFSKR
jgi:hypothetical protein